MDPSKIEELKGFISLVEKNPEIIHLAPLKFFKDFLVEWGANIPPEKAPKEDSAETKSTKPPTPEPKAPTEHAEEKKKENPVDQEEEEEELAEPEKPDFSVFVDLEDEERLEEESDPLPGRPDESAEVELTDDQMESLAEFKQKAVDALEDGDKDKALEMYSEAVMVGNPSALLFARRADLLLKLRRPVAAIADCDNALKLNPDSGRAYRIRGLACRRLQRWQEAHEALSMAQKIDYDDDTEIVHKFVDGKFKQMAELQRAFERKLEAVQTERRMREVKKRRAAAQKATEEQKNRDAEKPSEGGGPEMNDFMGLLNDPDVKELLQDPSCLQDPVKMQRMMKNPNVMKAMNMFGGMMGGKGKGKGKGMGGMGGMFGEGMEGMFGGAAEEAPPPAGSSAPGMNFNDDGGDP